MPEGTSSYIHASAVLLDESGVLIHGVAGTDKSSLALALVDTWTRHGEFARLVGDDRVACHIQNGRAVLSPHAVIAGRAEWRGLGLLPQQYELKAVLKLVVDLENSPLDGGAARMPEQTELLCDLNGLKNLPRLTYRSVATIMAFLHKLSIK